MTTTNDDESKLDNATVRRFAKLLKNNTETASPVVTGTVIQNGNEISVAVDSETIVPITDTNTNVNVGDKVTLSFSDDKALIIGNITDTNPTTSEVENIGTKATTAQETATTATKKAETAQKRAEGAEKVATNYIDIDENKGITVGNMTKEELGSNAYIDANGFYIRDNETVLASFEDEALHLAKTADSEGDATIYLCNDQAKISKLAGSNLAIENLVGTLEKGTGITLTGGYVEQSDSSSPLSVKSSIQIDSGVIVKSATGVSIQTTGVKMPKPSVGVTTYENLVSLNEKQGKFYYWKNDPTPSGDGGSSTTTIDYTGLNTTGQIKVNNTAVSLEGHTHTKDEITDFTHTHTKSDITDFDHTHTKSEISDFDHTHTKSDITDFDHTHGAGDITSGTLPLARGGTGQTTIAGLRTALGLDDAVQVVTVTSSYTAKANAGVQFNVTATTKTGYTFVGCIGNNTASAWCYFATCKKTSATNLQAYVMNMSSSSVTATAQFYLLYVKSIFV